MEAVMEKECSALGALFHTVIGDMKSSYPVWEDFISKAGKLQSQLRAVVAAAAAFLDAFQKVADLATSTRGGTRDIGSALTRMCMRHRSIEARLRQLSSVFIDCLINPLQEQMEEWKKGVNNLDKDHAKDYKKARQEIKKRSSDTLKLQKKAKKGKGDLQPRLDSALQDVSDKYLLLEETEKQALRRALIEERGRFCTFVSMLRPVVDEEISMLGEISHLQAITDDLKSLTMDPHKLPPASEQVILDLKGSDYSWSYQTPPSSPSTNASRKSSMCSSSLNSVHSSDSRSSGSRSRSPSSHCRYRSCTLPPQPTGRLSSVSSHDSGFVSQDAFQSKSPSPMPLEVTTQLSNGCNQYGPFDPPQLPGMGTVKSLLHFPAQSSSCSSSSSTSLAWSRPCPTLLPAYSPYCTLGPGMVPSSKVPTWKDWARPGPYDQLVVNTLKKRKDHGQEARSNVSVLQSECILTSRNATCTNPMSGTNKMEGLEAHEELALALAQGLPLDPQCSSRDSLRDSSGYSTQSTTPCCSEDAIHTQVSDYDCFCIGEEEDDQQDFEKSSTVPRGSDIGQSFRRVLQAQRPASTAGPVIITPGVATIRRTPSTKPSVKRVPGGGGPIPIKTAVVPVRTPTVPDLPGGYVLGVGGVVPPNPKSSVENPQWDEQLSEGPETPLEEGDSVHTNGEDMLLTIRRGVRLKKTLTNDRSAPRIA